MCDESISTRAEAGDTDENDSADEEETDAALDDTVDDETPDEEEEQRTRKKEREERKRGEEQSRRQRPSEEAQQPEEEEEDEDDKPVVRKRLRKLAEVKAARESKKTIKLVPMFSDDDSDGEERQREEAPARPVKKEKKERDGMRNKLRVLARQTNTEAVEDEPASGSESEGAEDGEDERYPADVEPVDDGGDEEAESDSEGDDQCAKPTVKPKALRTADADEKESDSVRSKPKHRAPVDEENEEQEADEEEKDDDDDEEEDTPSWRRLRKFVEPKGEPRATEKQSTTATDGRKKRSPAVESKGKDTPKQETTATKKSKNADEEFVEEDIERVQLWKGLSIPAKIWDGLYLYQKARVGSHRAARLCMALYLFSLYRYSAALSSCGRSTPRRPAESSA
jgi:hypothetical protein